MLLAWQTTLIGMRQHRSTLGAKRADRYLIALLLP